LSTTVVPWLSAARRRMRLLMDLDPGSSTSPSNVLMGCTVSCSMSMRTAPAARALATPALPRGLDPTAAALGRTRDADGSRKPQAHGKRRAKETRRVDDEDRWGPPRLVFMLFLPLAGDAFGRDERARIPSLLEVLLGEKEALVG